jgi:hypothetical protein
MDDLPDQLDKRANTYSWDSTTFYISDANIMRQAAAEIRRLRERVAELEAELGYHGIYPNPIAPRDTKADSDGDDGA